MNRPWQRQDITDAQVVDACRQFHDPFCRRDRRRRGDRDSTSLTILMAMTGAPEKVCEAAMQRGVDRHLIDCGISLRTAWPEPTGLALLEAS